MNTPRKVGPVRALLLAAPFVLFYPRPASPGAETFAPPRIERAGIRIDGKLDEPVWRSVAAIPELYQLCPAEGRPPGEKTEMRLFYDREAIYLGVRCFEDDPARIVSRTLERDSQTPDQDGVAILLDTLNDHRTAYGFIVSPGGVRTDIAVTNDGESPDKPPWNVEWNAFWKAAVSRDAEGWTAEMEIPFSSLRYETADGAAVMGIILWRYLARNKEFDVFPAIPNNWRFSAYKPSRGLDVTFTGIAGRHPLHIRPYVLGGYRRQHEPDPGGFLPASKNLATGRRSGYQIQFDSGLGLRRDAEHRFCPGRDRRPADQPDPVFASLPRKKILLPGTDRSL